MKIVLTIVLSLALLAGAFVAVKVLAQFRPVAEVVERPKLLPTVEVVEIKSADEIVQLQTQGLVEAARSSVIAAEVAGRVAEVAPQFNVGGRFAEGELLVRVEDADFKAALTQAEANLAESESTLVSEKARAEQSEREWKKLSNGQAASELALRKPQLASAQARVKAAASAVEKARRDLERTRITAPFAGRLRIKNTELGSYLTPGAPVGELSSVEQHEVRLPLSLNDLPFLPDGVTSVTLYTESGGRTLSWEAKVVRTEGEVERSSRSVFLVAQAAGKDNDDLLQPGLFVKARVRGVELKDVFRVPRSAFLDADRLMLIDSGNKVRFQRVEIVRADGADLLVSGGLKNGDRVCLTMLASPVEGMEVNTLAAPPDKASQVARP